MVELPYTSMNGDSVGSSFPELDGNPTEVELRMRLGHYSADAKALGSPLKEQVSIDEHPYSRIVDAPLCYECGTSMMKTGSCWCCPGCSSSGGCS
ncbi:vitamin B12-dependent ribonucleotide reductase [Acidithrix ferrooxidans]|uniref:Vitamin B12-dependent ribonucleotide reductase n=1 Tax=Acidithrix ferrooxidans TaxID=1280514 RepID=A0A0D8HL97_9ACTN|nr:vitamin B12-dependent ribonucleotide reductase [Acidithrix ferrooxidans]